MTPLTNRQQREEDDKLIELLRRLDGHSSRHDLIREVDICQTYGDNAQYLTLSKDGLIVSQLKEQALPKDTEGWSQVQWDAHIQSGILKERIHDYRACVVSFRGVLHAEQLQALLEQLGV